MCGSTALQEEFIPLGDQEAAPGSITPSMHPAQLGCGLAGVASPPQNGSQGTFSVSHFGFRALRGVPCQFLLLWLCLGVLCPAGLPLLLAENHVHGPEAQEGAHLEEELQPQIPVGCEHSGSVHSPALCHTTSVVSILHGPWRGWGVSLCVTTAHPRATSPRSPHPYLCLKRVLS